MAIIPKQKRKNIVERIFSAITGEDVEHQYIDPDYKEFLEIAERTGEPVVVKLKNGIELNINPPSEENKMHFDGASW